MATARLGVHTCAATNADSPKRRFNHKVPSRESQVYRVSKTPRCNPLVCHACWMLDLENTLLEQGQFDSHASCFVRPQCKRHGDELSGQVLPGADEYHNPSAKDMSTSGLP